MTNQEMLISYINKLTEDEISSLLEAASLMLETKEPAEKPPCPYCGCGKVIRYGHACQKQRFLCKYRHGKFTLPGIRLEGDGQGHPTWQCH